MADRKPRTGELTTANYGWTKPTVGASDDQWGGYLNADLDGIDGTVKGVSTVANAAYPASNPAGYITASAIPAPYVLPTASTTILGGVKVDGSTVTAAGDGTLTSHASGGIPEAPTDGKLYSRQNSAWTPTVVPLGDNRVINGDMRIDQRNNGASSNNGAGTGYWIDRWAISGNVPSIFSFGRNLNAITGPAGFPYYFGCQSLSAHASVATDQFQFLQVIEADMVSDFAWGTASAQSVTLSFLVYSSLIGAFGSSIGNVAGTRSYPFTFAISAANTWTKVAVAIPGDQTGAWVMSGNAGSVTLHFDLGSGANFRGPANAWASANYNGATGSVSVVATNGATFYVTGVKLEVGSVATPYNRQSLAKSMADCQRYYEVGTFNLWGYTLAGQTAGYSKSFAVNKRAVPTITLSSISNVNLSAPSAGGSPDAVTVNATGSTAGGFSLGGNFQASAEL